jgi:hypothetical protein
VLLIFKQGKRKPLESCSFSSRGSENHWSVVRFLRTVLFYLSETLLKKVFLRPAASPAAAPGLAAVALKNHRKPQATPFFAPKSCEIIPFSYVFAILAPENHESKH